jgi:low temperature requirement protein LtrA
MPIVTGVIIFAVGVKKTLAHIDGDLGAVAAVALCGGAALYLLALSAFKRRNLGSWNGPRLVGASALVALVPIATAIPAVVALGIVAAVCLAVVTYETVAYADYRDRVRHG